MSKLNLHYTSCLTVVGARMGQKLFICWLFLQQLRYIPWPVWGFMPESHILPIVALFSKQPSSFPLGTLHHFSLADQVQSDTEDTTKSQFSRKLRLDFPGHRLQGPLDSCLGPSVPINLPVVSLCITPYRLTHLPTFSKENSYATQAVETQKNIRYQRFGDNN